MVDFTTPYAMDGTILPGEALRRILQDQVGVGSGVSRAGDLKVSAMDTPDKGIKIMPGHDLIQCRAPGRDRETYQVQLNAAANWMGDSGDGIPGTGSGTPNPSTGVLRRDMIIHEILDPDLPRHFTPVENWPAGAVSKLSVVQNVPLGAVRVDQVPALNEVTCYEVAAIDWPPSTTTIAPGMVKNLRRVQSPKSQPFKVAFALSGDEVDPVTAMSGYPAGGETWPIQAEVAGQLLVPIPEWATHVLSEITMHGVVFPGGNAAGALWLRIGANTGLYVSGQDTGWDSDGVASKQRVTMGVAAKIAIPAAMRGTTQQFRPRATRTAGSNATTARLDRISSFVIDGMFIQEAV